ncbi:rhomboid family intramembrane serine protease [Bacillus wiedmannii]|uniref:rhomboid family intramembrane serine protease n=1 Tax=Bacillus wiedmannii TaxID=1890302 RepID=UPI003D99195E
MSIFVRNENLSTFIKRYPVTSIIVFITTLIFILTCIDGGPTNIHTVIKYGGLSQPLFSSGEYFRLVTYLFPHVGGVTHFLCNISFILILSPTLERIMGSFRQGIIFLLSGIIGGIFVIYFTPEVVVGGASGAGYGMLGTFLSLIYKRNTYIDNTTKKYIFFITAINVIYTFTGENISIPAHFGGLITGFFLSTLLINHTKSRNIATNYLAPITVTLVILGGYIIYQDNLTIIRKVTTTSDTNTIEIINDANWFNEKYKNIYPLMNELIDNYNQGISNHAEKKQFVIKIEKKEDTIQKIISEISKKKFNPNMNEPQALLLEIFNKLNEVAEYSKLVINNEGVNSDNKFSKSIDDISKKAEKYNQSLIHVYEKAGIQWTSNEKNQINPAR